MSVRRSYRVASRRICSSQAKVLSTTQRCRPSRWVSSTPRLAIRAWIWRLLQARRQRAKSYALSAWSLRGRWRGRPRRPATGGTSSSRTDRGTLSCILAPERTTASGVPFRSVSRCRLVPGRPRSVGFGPMADPPFLPWWRHYPCKHDPNPVDQLLAGIPATSDEAFSRHRLHASHAAVASKWRRSRIPFLKVTSPKGCLT